MNFYKYDYELTLGLAYFCRSHFTGKTEGEHFALGQQAQLLDVFVFVNYIACRQPAGCRGAQGQFGLIPTGYKIAVENQRLYSYNSLVNELYCPQAEFSPPSSCCPLEPETKEG